METGMSTTADQSGGNEHVLYSLGFMPTQSSLFGAKKFGIFFIILNVILFQAGNFRQAHECFT